MWASYDKDLALPCSLSCNGDIHDDYSQNDKGHQHVYANHTHHKGIGVDQHQPAKTEDSERLHRILHCGLPVDAQAHNDRTSDLHRSNCSTSPLGSSSSWQTSFLSNCFVLKRVQRGQEYGESTLPSGDQPALLIIKLLL